MPITQSKASARVRKRFPEIFLIESDHAGLTAFTIIAPYLSNRLVFDGGFFIHSQTDHKKIVVNSLDLQLLLHNYFAKSNASSDSNKLLLFIALFSVIIINELKKTLCILSHEDMTQFMRLNCTIFLSFHLAKKKQQQQDP